MIAEPGILSTSPWNSDLLLKDLQSELFRPYLSISDAFDMGFQLMDTDNNDAWTRSVRGDSRYDAGGSSCTPSSASSECSDELNLDVTWPTAMTTTTTVAGTASSSDSNRFQLADHDYLNNSLSLLDNNLEVCPSDCDFDWVAGEDLVVSTVFHDESSCEGTSSSTSLSNGSKCRRSRSFSDAVASNKLWSRMKLQEQLEAVDALTNIVSNELGLREQLDVIRIIEPSAVVSPTDKEFVIDLNSLNDQKLCKVREYVRRVQSAESSTQQVRPNEKDNKSKTKPASTATTTTTTTTTTSTSTANGPINVINQGSSTTAGVSSVSSPSKGKHSKKEAKEKRPPQKVFKQRQKKEYKQLMKERRSGLFQREEVLSLKTAEIIEDDDIDILG